MDSDASHQVPDTIEDTTIEVSPQDHSDVGQLTAISVAIVYFLTGVLEVLWSLTPDLLVNIASSAIGLAYLLLEHWAGTFMLGLVLIIARALYLVFTGLAELGYRAVPYVHASRGRLNESFEFNLPVAPQSASVMWRIVSGNGPINCALFAVCAVYAAAHLYFPGEDYSTLFRGVEVTKRPAAWRATLYRRLSSLLGGLSGRGAEDLRKRQNVLETDLHRLVTCILAFVPKIDAMNESFERQEVATDAVVQAVNDMHTDLSSQLEKIYGFLESEGCERQALSEQLLDQDALLGQVKELKNEVDVRTGQLSLASAKEQALREELSAKKAQEDVLVSQISELQKETVSLKLKHAAERDSLLRHFEQNANANMNWARSVQGLIGSSQQQDLHAKIEEIP